MGVRRVTTVAPVAGTPPERAPTEALSEAPATPYRLLLSAPASSVEIDTGGITRPDPGRNPVTGILHLDPTNPRLSLVVRWKSPPGTGEHRFARLTLEAPGQDTFVHVFDADGDIDDFLELPLPATP